MCLVSSSADAQSVPVLNSTARYSTVQYSKVPEGVPEGVTDSTPESSDSDCNSERSVSGGGGGRVDTDRTVPLTSDVPVESEPTCKASVVPAVGTNAHAADQLPRVRAQGMPWVRGWLQSQRQSLQGVNG